MFRNRRLSTIITGVHNPGRGRRGKVRRNGAEGEGKVKMWKERGRKGRGNGSVRDGTYPRTYDQIHGEERYAVAIKMDIEEQWWRNEKRWLQPNI